MRSPAGAPFAAVLFDLDGTLVDTAADLTRALNVVRGADGLAPVSLEAVRPVVSLGLRAMLQAAYGVADTDRRFPELRARFLAEYTAHLADHTRVFPGMHGVLQRLETRGRPWGVVTNKITVLTEPLLDSLGLLQRAACVVCGDTTAHRKPHPEPVQHACALIGADPSSCLFVGDSSNDVRSGLAAGVYTLVALFGYIPSHEDPTTWGAHGTVSAPGELLAWLN